MAFVTIELLNTCVESTLSTLKADPQAYQAALAAAGGDEYALAHQIVGQCLKQLGSNVTADQLTACSTAELSTLQSDPQAYAEQLAFFGGDATQLYNAIIATCLERLQTTTPPVVQPVAAKTAEKKTPWGWIIGGTLAAAVIGAVIYSADSKKPAPKRSK